MRAAMTSALCVLSLCFSLSAAEGLQIVHPVFHQYEGGPVLDAGNQFLAGGNVVFGFQIANIKDDNGVFKLRYQVMVTDKDGVLLVEPFVSGAGGELTDEDRKSHWMPKVTYEFQLPTILLPGEYTIRAQVRDEVGGTQVQQDIPLHIGGPVVEPSDTLVIRNFRFLRSDTDTTPLDQASYRPGDTVWGRFEITGYKIGEKNSFKVDFGLAIQDESGKQLYADESAAEDSGSPFYPHKFVRGVLNFSTQADTATGPYILVVTVHDRVGNQVSTTKHPFRLE